MSMNARIMIVITPENIMLSLRPLFQKNNEITTPANAILRRISQWTRLKNELTFL